jgi:hypothetical protein
MSREKTTVVTFKLKGFKTQSEAYQRFMDEVKNETVIGGEMTIYASVDKAEDGTYNLWAKIEAKKSNKEV